MYRCNKINFVVYEFVGRIDDQNWFQRQPISIIYHIWVREMVFRSSDFLIYQRLLKRQIRTKEFPHRWDTLQLYHEHSGLFYHLTMVRRAKPIAEQDFSFSSRKKKHSSFAFFSGLKRSAPQRPREHPPSLPDQSIPRSPSPLGSMSSLHDVLKVNDTL